MSVHAFTHVPKRRSVQDATSKFNVLSPSVTSTAAPSPRLKLKSSTSTTSPRTPSGVILPGGNDIEGGDVNATNGNDIEAADDTKENRNLHYILGGVGVLGVIALAVYMSRKQ